jgi:Mn-dependent DtxR family transcriptional regulator/DNA-binding Xre family transcriptional regulator
MFMESGVRGVRVSYGKLWRLLANRKIKRGELSLIAGVGNSTLTKMSRDENVNMDMLVRVCGALNCDLWDVAELLPDDGASGDAPSREHACPPVGGGAGAGEWRCRTDKLTFTMENYLEAVYELSQTERGARLTDVAARLSVNKSTAVSAMSALAEKGLVEDGRYRRIVLTEAGRVMASAVAEKHRTIRRFLTESLNLDAEAADADACAIEHVISDTAIGAMRSFLRGRAGESNCTDGGNI